MMMTMKSLKLLSFTICVCILVGIKSVKCDEDDSLFQYDGETSMSNVDDANKEIYEDDQPVSGERFIAVRVGKMGATESLKPNLVGLSNMAIQFLPTDFKFVEVLEATREIVSGVRYELFVAALDENDEAVLCRIVVTELTWKLTAWGEKQRDLNYSNCTSNATTDDNVPNPNDFSFNPLFVRKSNTISDDELKLIESQILKPKQTDKSLSKPKISQSFDLSNLEAMIIPAKSLPKSVKATLSPHTLNELRDHTQKTSESQLVGDCNQNQPYDKKPTSDVLQESQLKIDSIDTNSKLLEASHETITKSLNFPVLLNVKGDSENPTLESNVSESVQNENNLSELRFEEKTLKSEDGDTNEPSVLKVTSESLIPNQNGEVERSDIVTSTEILKQTERLTPHKINESETEHLVEGTTSPEVLKNDEVKVHPKTENASLRMDDSIVPSSETVMVFESLTDGNRAINEATESFKYEENVDNREIDRPKRDINTEMLFLKQLTDEALEQLDHVDSDNLKRIALDIIRVKKIDQDNGAVYVIKVRTANSDCLEESDGQQTCLDNIRKDTIKICFIEVKSKRDVNRVTKSECKPDKSNKMEMAEPIRSKKDTNDMELETPEILGGLIETDPDEAKYVEKIVSDALVTYSQIPDSQKYGLHRIKSSIKQVVSGILYKVDAEFILPNNDVRNCYIELVVKEWIKPEPEILQLNCGKDDEVTRTKRSLFYDSHLDEEPQETEYDRNVAMMFDEFKAKYNKRYESAMEHATRLRLFKHNLHVINQLNQYEMGTATYGITEFADFTLLEYKRRTGLLQRRENNEIPLPFADIPDIDLPKSFDWRDKGAVTEVKNQGSCGSCWAFSVTGNIEGLNAIKTGKLEEFSEQELVDCDTVDSGCNGGLPDNAYKAIEAIGGLETESAYPYDAKKSKCRFDASLARVKVSGAVDLPKNETAMAQYLVQNGPLSIGINANAMQFYRGGISHPPRILCRHSSIDHGVLIVGYGVAEYPVFNKTLPYWIVKNSWGPEWGEKGYYRVFRGADTCGLTSMVSSAVLG
ncbi:putative cysteine proteinase CG12163 isoform X2 [Bradysia coprophila]|uniref:putative cysteine proteinase CG12163 isoform X2 n=1 Tax=Bradysia coprophila TaxID=38358 RepID=UPI00187DB521|nr:putative cysteine proteinase CG12163 isoform X2 [Bradysia coprophila]